MNAAMETEIIEAFVSRERRERCLSLLRSARRRREFLTSLYHFDGFDRRCIAPLHQSVDSASRLLRELRARGAPDDCYVISVDERLDGSTGSLDDVILRVFGLVEGTIVSCVGGTLAYYEGEAPRNRFLLVRADNRRQGGRHGSSA